MAAHAEKDKEYQSLREQWEVLATAALARDAALAKAQEEVRSCLLPALTRRRG